MCAKAAANLPPRRERRKAHPKTPYQRPKAPKLLLTPTLPRDAVDLAPVQDSSAESTLGALQDATIDARVRSASSARKLSRPFGEGDGGGGFLVQGGRCKGWR